MKFLTKWHTAFIMEGIPRRARSPSVDLFGVWLMHIPDAVLAPHVVLVTSGVGAVGLMHGLRVVERQLKESTTSLMGMMSAFLFAAQMVNFPVGPGVSGHLLGGVLAAVIVGPWAGSVVIAAVLIVQCFLFRDGGVTALGANFVNMGLIGSVGGYAIYAPIRRFIGGRRGTLIAAMIASWFAVLLASGACAVELSVLGSRGDFFRVLSWMALVHAAIGLGEAVITGLVVRFILQTRPDLIGHDPEPPLEPETSPKQGRSSWSGTVLAGLGISLGVAVFLSPFASQLPDGLEFVGEKTGLLPDEASSPTVLVPAPMPDYQLALPGWEQIKIATAVAGLVGTLAVFCVSWSLARVFAIAHSVPGTEGAGPHAP
jgi:cobalt/nickel transport system permease protein